VILVEGASDRIALEALAERLELPRPEVAVLGGAHGVRNAVALLGVQDAVALCDEGEARLFGDAGLAADRIFVCRRDLEDELIRALGVERVEQVFEAQGDLGLLRVLQQQPAQRGRPAEQHVHRFIGAHSGAKARYARALVEALDLGAVPAPLEGALRLELRGR
jgi:hypothetical protein